MRRRKKEAIGCLFVGTAIMAGLGYLTYSVSTPKPRHVISSESGEILIYDKGRIEYKEKKGWKERVEKAREIKVSLKEWQDHIDSYFNENLDYPSDLEVIIEKLEKFKDNKSTYGLSAEYGLKYKRTTYSFLTKKNGSLTIIRNVPHYELFCFGPDKIPRTFDDIDVEGNEYGSTARLEAKFERDLKEANKTPLEKMFDKGDKLIKEMFEEGEELFDKYR